MGTILLMGAGLQTTVTGPTYDPDAQLFFNAQAAAGVTLTTTQKNAVNQWVVDAKAIGIWTKFKAIYPIVGGTATSHKFNLKNPLDTNAAFRLSFIGGWTHSSTGALPNGTNAYADTFLTPSTVLSSINNSSFSFYNRTSNAYSNSPTHGIIPSTTTNRMYVSDQSPTGYQIWGTENVSFNVSYANSDRKGFYTATRTASNSRKTYRNGAVVGSNTGNDTGGALSSISFTIGAANGPYIASTYTNNQLAFATIGDGLTDLESQVFYQITEKYQVALSRNINTTQSFYYNSAYNNETNAFLFSTQITNTTIQTATNTLVSDLKTANIFTKMKAIYPMVGGTATTHKFNLVNAQDSTAAFALSFIGGWTHSANGALPNGTNSYANTFFVPNINSSGINNFHGSYYSRTDVNLTQVESGCGSSDAQGTLLEIRTANLTYIRINAGTVSSYADTNSLGFYLQSRLLINEQKGYKNGILKITGAVNSNAAPGNNYYIGAYNNATTGTVYYSSKQCAFASIGDGLSDAESLALYNAVNAFQVSLARNV